MKSPNRRESLTLADSAERSTVGRAINTVNLRPRHPVAASAHGALRRSLIGAGLEACSAVASVIRPGRAAGLGIILMLHHVRPAASQRFDPNALLSITPEFLDRAVRRLKAIGMRPVDLAEMPEVLARGDASDRVFAVTLDDGYRNNIEHALPVFERHDVPFTIFVTTGFVERRCTLWWETAEKLIRGADMISLTLGGEPQRFDIRSQACKAALFQSLFPVMTGPMQRQAITALDAAARGEGIEPLDITDELIMSESELRALAGHHLARLEPHTVTHPALAQLGRAELMDEIQTSVARLRSWTARDPQIFAYPYGGVRAAGDREFQAIREAGLRLAVTTRAGVLMPGSQEKLASLPRASLNGLFQKERYVDALASGLPFGFSRILGR